MQKFEINSDFLPTGDQPQAIEELVKGSKKEMNQTLLGVTGSGKTFTVDRKSTRLNSSHVRTSRMPSSA